MDRLSGRIGTLDVPLTVEALTATIVSRHLQGCETSLVSIFGRSENIHEQK